jgi:hypothetical protein
VARTDADGDALPQLQPAAARRAAARPRSRRRRGAPARSHPGHRPRLADAGERRRSSACFDGWRAVAVAAATVLQVRGGPLPAR